MNLLAELFGAGDRIKRRVKDFAANPGDYLSAANARVSEDTRAFNALHDLAIRGDPEAERAISEMVMENALGAGVLRTKLAPPAARPLRPPLADRPISPPSAEQMETASVNAQKMLGLPAGNTASDRMAALGMDPGWWRGGATPTVGRTGPWYSADRDVAEDFAHGFSKRTGRPSDVREYALQRQGYMSAAPDIGYPPVLRDDLLALLDRGDLGVKGRKFASIIRANYAPTDKINIGEFIQGMKANVSGDLPRAMDDSGNLLGKLGVVGVRDVVSPGYRYAFPGASVRDVRAAFDPARINEDNIMAAALAVPLGASGRDQAGR